jgi:ornithine--oxo-acid transaminase
VLAKDTHDLTIRLAPPLVAELEEIDWAIDQLAGALQDLVAAPAVR